MATGFLTAAERARLNTYPKEIASGDLGRFFTLTPHDLALVAQQRSDHNRLGFALQLGTLRYLGFIPDNLLEPSPAVLRLLAHQLDTSPAAISGYGERQQTRSDHLAQIMAYLDYRRATPHDLTALESWLVERALEHDRPTFLLHLATERLHGDRILRPGLTRLESVVAAARQRAQQLTYEQVTHLLSAQGQSLLDDLLELVEGANRTTLSWLQRMPNDHTPSQIMATLDKIRFLQQAGVPQWDLSAVNPNRLKFLANIGAKSTNQQLQRSSPVRRYPVLIAFLKQALFETTDLVIDLFDACLWQRHTAAKKELDQLRLWAARSTNEKLRTVSSMAKIVVNGEVPDAAVRTTVFERFSSDHLQQIIEETEQLMRPPHDEAIDLFAQRYSCFC